MMTNDDTNPVEDIDLSIDLVGIGMHNPLTTASGTTGYGPELSGYFDLSQLGAFTTKSITVQPRRGNRPPRIVETRSGVINSIGLANVGVDRFISDKLPAAAALGIPIFVNIAGRTVQDYVRVAAKLDPIEQIAALEANISCPNVDAGGLEFGTDAGQAYKLVTQVRKQVKRAKLIVKLSPNVTDICEIARAVIDAGADIISLINTVKASAIDVETRRLVLARGSGGLSGPAIHPVAVFAVWQVYKQVARPAGVPVIGMGGVQMWQDALELILAGASAVAVGTAMFIDPQTPANILAGLGDYCRRHDVSRLSDLVGTVSPPTST